MHNGLKFATTLWILIVTAITQESSKKTKYLAVFVKM